MKLQQIIIKHAHIRINRETIINIFEKNWLKINIKSEIKFMFTCVYSLNITNQKIINKKFDKLHKNNKVEWTKKPMKYNYSVFIVWRNVFSKVRIVINIRKLNKITKTNIYSMFLQIDIISSCSKYKYILIINKIKCFHQFLIHKSNWKKFIFIFHKNQKTFNVILFDFENFFFIYSTPKRHYVQIISLILLCVYKWHYNIFKNFWKTFWTFHSNISIFQW